MFLKFFLQDSYNKLVIIAIVFIFFCAIDSTAGAYVQAPDEELVQLLNNIHTMQAAFKQFTVNHVGVQMWQKTVGTVALERPGKFRWEVTWPNRQLIIINEGKLLLYDIDLAQVTKRKVNYKKLGNTAVLLSGSAETLKQMFKIIKLEKSGEGVWFELKSRKKNNANNDYQCVKMYFVAGQLRAIYAFDNLGQLSEIHFKNGIVNSKISKDKFVFVAPSQVDVFDEDRL